MHYSVLETIDILSRTPATLGALIDGLPETWLVKDEGDGTFSPRDVVGHLILGEKTDWVPRIDCILRCGQEEAFVPFDRFDFREANIGCSTSELLEEFASIRASNLAHVQGLSLTATQMALTGRHPDLGVVTLGELFATWVVHDYSHIGQVVRVLSKQFTDAVGPWKAYFGILNR